MSTAHPEAEGGGEIEEATTYLRITVSRGALLSWAARQHRERARALFRGLRPRGQGMAGGGREEDQEGGDASRDCCSAWRWPSKGTGGGRRRARGRGRHRIAISPRKSQSNLHLQGLGGQWKMIKQLRRPVDIRASGMIVAL